MASFQSQTPAKTLKDAVSEPQVHRDMEAAAKPMPNFSSTPGGPHGCPLTFRASWTLNSRPRRIALLLDDTQEEYRPYAQSILPNLVRLLEAFRSKDCRVVWSSWARRFDDGISNAMDRWYGPHGLRPEAPENAAYIFTGQAGLEPLEEIAPTAQERADGWYYHSLMLDMFWLFDENGKSYLDEKLKAEGIDTVVISGLWTDECIVSTAYAALSRGYDVVVVSDAVATATAHQDKALTIMNATCGKVLSTDEIVSYIENDYVVGKVGAVKGVRHPDGRKDLIMQS